MALLNKFIWIYPDGKPSKIEDWVITLPIEEQTEFFAAQKRNIEFRDQAIKEGRMKITEEGYEWINEEEFKKNKPHDPIWEQYFQRWLQETGIRLGGEEIIK